MNSIRYPKNEPFDAVTGNQRPEYRGAYLLGQLTPVPAQQIEAYLGKSPIQKSVLLGRYHELAATATATGRTLVPPRWVHLQLHPARRRKTRPWCRPSGATSAMPKAGRCPEPRCWCPAPSWRPPPTPPAATP